MILLKNLPCACCKLSVRATINDDGDGAVRDWLNGAAIPEPALLELVKMPGCLGKDKKNISGALIFNPGVKARLRR